MTEDIKKPGILIVDDDMATVKVLRSTLPSDYELLFALNAQEGIASATANQPDLILLDIMMPVMDGYEACHQLKADERTRDIPIIFITGKTHEEDVVKGFDLGALDYITKPFNPVIVNARVRSHVSLRLARRNKEAHAALKRHAKELEEANTALRVVIHRQNSDQQALEEKLQRNINDLVVPYLKKLRDAKLDDEYQNCLSVLEGNLSNIASPFMVNFLTAHKKMTPQEIQIIDLIRKGMETKEIAEMLHASTHTIATHRNNIRKKLELKNCKMNLRSYLLSLQ